ncbi:hypothetical protein, partial [Heyndrickxia sporothermodurans]|uniref:hypothetical protein n=1 Tax=Heyndrickxia sporothermodurans TaxID=46224 RepID=UPI000D4F38FF
MPSRWTIYQCIVVLFLVILLFIVEMFKSYFSVSLSLNGTSTIIPLLLTFLFIILVVGCSRLLMIFQTKKSTLFLTHRIWMKMYILTPLLLILSITFFLTAA